MSLLHISSILVTLNLFHSGVLVLLYIKYINIQYLLVILQPSTWFSHGSGLGSKCYKLFNYIKIPSVFLLLTNDSGPPGGFFFCGIRILFRSVEVSSSLYRVCSFGQTAPPQLVMMCNKTRPENVALKKIQQRITGPLTRKVKDTFVAALYLHVVKVLLPYLVPHFTLIHNRGTP